MLLVAKFYGICIKFGGLVDCEQEERKMMQNDDRSKLGTLITINMNNLAH